MNLVEWIDARTTQADNVNKSFLGFARRFITGTGIPVNMYNDLCAAATRAQFGLSLSGDFERVTKLNNTISIIRCYQRTYGIR